MAVPIPFLAYRIKSQTERHAVIHFTCDRCGRSIDPKRQLRYAVGIQIQAKMDGTDLGAEREDEDPLLSIEQILEAASDLADELVGNDIQSDLQFDLCVDCYRRFVKNPLGARSVPALPVSQN